jgi:hypothetical protein
MELDGSLIACYTIRSENYSSESAENEMPLKKTDAIARYTNKETRRTEIHSLQTKQ